MRIGPAIRRHQSHICEIDGSGQRSEAFPSPGEAWGNARIPPFLLWAEGVGQASQIIQLFAPKIFDRTRRPIAGETSRAGSIARKRIALCKRKSAI